MNGEGTASGPLGRVSSVRLPRSLRRQTVAEEWLARRSVDRRGVPAGPPPGQAERSDREVVLPIDEPVGPVLSLGGEDPSRRKLIRSGVLVSVAAIVSNGFNVVFHFATARLLTTSEYSLLTTMFAVFLIGTVPLLAIQATISREMSALLGAGQPHAAAVLLRSTLVRILRFAAAALVVAFALFVPLLFLLHIDRLLPVVAVSFAFLVQVPLPVVGGALSATERFGVLSATGLVQVVLKLAVGVGFAALGLGAAAITLGVGAAIGVGVALSLLALRPLLAGTRGSAPLPGRRIVGRYALGAALILTAHTALTQLDLVWARATLDSDEAGLYAAASVLTSSILLIPIGVTTVVFPRVARLKNLREGDPYLRVSAAIVAALSLVAVLGLAALPRLAINLTLGPQYDGAASWLWPLGIAMGLYGVTIVYLNHFLAQGRTRVLGAIGGVLVLQQVLFGVLHASGPEIVTVQLLTSGCAVFACATYDHLSAGRWLPIQRSA